MLKSTLSLMALTATVFSAESDSGSEGSWSLPTSPRTDHQSVDMSLTGSPYSANASKGSADMSLCSSAETTPTHQRSASTGATPSPTQAQLAAMARKVTSSSNGKGRISPEEFAAMMNSSQ